MHDGYRISRKRLLGTFKTVAAMAFACLFAAPTGHAAPSGQSDLTGRLIMGYQGWFACPTDGTRRGWSHWQEANHPVVDLLPDVSEFAPANRCVTQMKTTGGQPISLYSNQDTVVVNRHFEWMRQYGIDGVAVQRYASQLMQAPAKAAMNAVLAKIRSAAEQNGRTFFIMYDLSGMRPDMLPLVVADWQALETDGLLQSSAYARHQGRAVIGLWGLGFQGFPVTPKVATQLIAAVRQTSAPDGGVTILGGVSSRWRTGTVDASPDAAWRAVWPKLDVLSPWTVGRYNNDVSADAWLETVLKPDIAQTRRLGIEYMPVVFPGVSWHNVMHLYNRYVPSNQVPRNCGQFYWRQVRNAIAGGSTMMYNAMFDEVNEGTAMFKMVPSSATGAPASGVAAGTSIVTLDADGCKLPSDYYLQLAGAAATALRTQTVPSDRLPPGLLSSQQVGLQVGR